MDEPELIERIYESITEHGGLAGVLPLLMQWFNAQSGVLFLSDTVRQDGSFLETVGHMADPGLTDSYASVASVDPAPALFRALRTGEALTMFQALPSTVLARDVFYQEWYSTTAGLGDCLGLRVLRNGNRDALLCVQRAFDASAFSPRDVSAARRLAPHLERAAALHRHVQGITQQGQVAQAMLDQIGQAAFLVDAAGVVQAHSAEAARIAAAGDGLSMRRDGLLAVADPAASRQLARAVAAALATPPTVEQSLPARRPSGKEAYLIRVTRFHLPAGAAWPLCLVLVRDPEAGKIPSEPMMQIFRLTRSEAALVQNLLAGLTLEGHSARSGVSVNTAKTQLRSAFQKTGARSQADLINVVSRTFGR
jgi:DNA-binding CsgD family transcriptional regulator